MLENGNSLTTVGIYLRSLRIIMNTAKDYNLITEEMYPFGSRYRRKYEIPSGSNTKKALSIEEIRKIKNAECPNKDSEFARDMWMFAFYCNGMNMVDVFSLKYRDIAGNYLLYNRKKTYRTIRDQKPLDVYLPEPALDIIKKWGNKDTIENSYIFNVFCPDISEKEKHRLRQTTIRRINGYMWRLDKKLGIKIKPSTSVARHTWATLLKISGTPIEEISEGLGHSNILTTKKYMDSFPKEHKKIMTEKLLDLIK